MDIGFTGPQSRNTRHEADFLPPDKVNVFVMRAESNVFCFMLEQWQEKTRALKQGMMQELLTGRVRLVQGTEGTRVTFDAEARYG